MIYVQFMTILNVAQVTNHCHYIHVDRKYKLASQQNGQVYLTSHRICYVDKQEPRKHSVALDLKDVERYEFYVRAVRLKGSINFRYTY